MIPQYNLGDDLTTEVQINKSLTLLGIKSWEDLESGKTDLCNIV